MLQQLTASLGSLADVRSVRITVGGLPLAGARRADRSRSASSPSAPNPLVMVEGRFGFLNGSSVTGVPDISGKVEGLGPTAVTLGRGRDGAAVLSATGASAGVSPTERIRFRSTSARA